MRDLYGEYIIAGMNRKLAEFYHYQMRFDCLAVMAVTVFHLSHWRVNMAISSYLLPALQEGGRSDQCGKRIAVHSRGIIPAGMPL